MFKYGHLCFFFKFLSNKYKLVFLIFRDNNALIINYLHKLRFVL